MGYSSGTGVQTCALPIYLRKAAADPQYIRLAVGKFGGGLAEVEPVRPAKIARIGLAAGARGSQLLLKALQFVERFEQRPGFHPVAVVGLRDQPQDAAVTALSAFKGEDLVDRVGAGPGASASCSASG